MHTTSGTTTLISCDGISIGHFMHRTRSTSYTIITDVTENCSFVFKRKILWCPYTLLLIHAKNLGWLNFGIVSSNHPPHKCRTHLYITQSGTTIFPHYGRFHKHLLYMMPTSGSSRFTKSSVIYVRLRSVAAKKKTKK